MNNMQHALSFRPLRSSDGLRCRPVQALGAIFLGLASLAYSVTSQAADEPENVKVVRQYLDAWNGGRTDAMEKCSIPTSSISIPAMKRPALGLKPLPKSRSF